MDSGINNIVLLIGNNLWNYFYPFGIFNITVMCKLIVTRWIAHLIAAIFSIACQELEELFFFIWSRKEKAIKHTFQQNFSLMSILGTNKNEFHIIEQYLR